MARSERRGAGTEAAGRRPHGRLGVRASGRPSTHPRSGPVRGAPPGPEPPLRTPLSEPPGPGPPASAHPAPAQSARGGRRNWGPGTRERAGRSCSRKPGARGSLFSRLRAPLASAVPRGCLGLGPGASGWALFLPRVAGVQGSVSAAQPYTKFRAGVSGLAAQCSPAPSVPSFGADTGHPRLRMRGSPEPQRRAPNSACGVRKEESPPSLERGCGQGLEDLEFQAKDLGPPEGQGSAGSLGVAVVRGVLITFVF